MSYQTKGKLNTNAICLFTAEDGAVSSHLKPVCGWRDGAGVVRAGTWLGGWQRIEDAWSFDKYGQWQGAAPLLYQPIQMQARTASNATIAPERQGDDWVWRVASGESFFLDWLRKTVFDTGSRSAANATFLITDANDGSIVRSGAVTQLPFAQTTLPDGSYCAYVVYEGVQEGLRLPAGYARDPDYDYTTGDGRDSHYNPVLYVGEVPADPDHALNVLRRELIAENANEDNAEYSRYVTSEAAQNGEGAAIKLQVGVGEWQSGAGVFVTPSRALCELDFDAPVTLTEGESNSTPVPVAFDPLAHVVSFVLHTRPDGIWGGKVLLGGARFSPDGARPSLWQWNADNSATLLGSAAQSCEPLCEQMLSTGLVTSLAELNDGSIIMLTLCSRHRYDATGATPETRLPRYPLATDGEPGGRSMTSIDDTRVFHTTESLKRKPDPDTESFYNITIDIQGDKLVYAGGTVANVDGCLWRHRSKTWGVRIDANDGKTYLSTYDGKWRGVIPLRTDWISLQRGASVNGMNLAFGYDAPSEAGRAIRDDGRRVQVLACDYRLRGGIVTRHAANANLQSYLAPARFFAGGELSAAWALVELDGSGLLPDGDGGFEGDDGVLPPSDPLDELGVGDNRFWRVLRLSAESPIHVLQIRDMMETQAFKAANADAGETEIGVRIRIDSEADLDDFSSYIYRPRLDKAFVLPVAALEKVEVLVVTRDTLAPEQLPEIGVAA